MLEQAPQGQREQESARDMQDEVEQQLESLNQQLHQTLQTSAVMEALKELREPPEVAGNGYQDQVEYLEETLVMVEKIFQEHHEQLDIVRQAKSGVEEAQNAADKHLQRVDEYETVIAGLWEILSAEPRPGRLTPQSSMDGMRSNSLSAAPGSRSPTSPIREDFSLQAFSARVQHLSDVANGAREQQEILRRQIQQQRDLNGKTDMEKNREVEELQARYEALNQSYDATQHELTKAIENHAHADQEAREAQAELSNAMEELEQLRQTVMDYDDRNKEIEEREQQLDVEKKNLSAAKDAAEEELARVQKEMQDMESELVRLTTELTMSKAELEGAYGTRAERQKEAGAAEKELDALAQLKDQEIAQLRREQTEKTRLLEQELQDMMGDFQEMTRESLELEKERGQLETLIDSLRERVEQLETQLDDDRIRHIGLKPPGTASGDGPRETTSVTVLRQEFKKMMRESRMEAVKLLKVSRRERYIPVGGGVLTFPQAEREERRALETEVRKMRQLNSPLGRQSLPGGHSAKNSLAHIRFGSISSNSNPVHGAASASATATSAPGMSPGASTAGYSGMAHAMSAPGTVIE
jgi:DNA repair exonuclease SbcCD ATPase subunit